MGRRFNNLRAAIKYLRNIGADPNAPNPEAPAGTQLRRFQEYEAGMINVNYPRAEGSKPGELLIFQLRPFGLPAANTDVYAVPISSRTRTNGLAPFGLSEAELGIDPVTTNARQVEGFIPAKAICRIQTNRTPGSPRTSQITGARYRPIGADSYTLPFGRTTSRPTVSEQKQVILTSVEAVTAITSVSFRAEVF
jgi:hypothetical protein